MDDSNTSYNSATKNNRNEGVENTLVKKISLSKNGNEIDEESKEINKDELMEEIKKSNNKDND